MGAANSKQAEEKKPVAMTPQSASERADWSSSVIPFRLQVDPLILENISNMICLVEIHGEKKKKTNQKHLCPFEERKFCEIRLHKIRYLMPFFFSLLFEKIGKNVLYWKHKRSLYVLFNKS